MGSGIGQGGAGTLFKNTTVNSDIVLNKGDSSAIKIIRQTQKSICPHAMKNNQHQYFSSTFSSVFFTFAEHGSLWSQVAITGSV